jgi:endonuclease YncB( thermonuclease family)
MIRAALAVLLLILAPIAQADTTWTIEAHDVDRVYDGDTFYITLNGLPPVFGDELPIRVGGVDTPELRSRCETEELKEREKALGREAAELTRQLLAEATEIRLVDLERGSFFRVVARIWIDGQALDDRLIDAGLGARTYGDDGVDWCEILAAQ